MTISRIDAGARTDATARTPAPVRQDATTRTTSTKVLGGFGADFDPASLSLFARYRASDNVLNGSAIEQLTDLVGTRHLRERNGPDDTLQMPALVDPDSAFKGKASADFSAAGRRLRAPDASLADWNFLHHGAGATVLAVVDLTAGAIRQICGTYQASGGTQGVFLRWDDGSLRLFIGNDSTSLWKDTSGVAAGGVQLVGFRFDLTAAEDIILIRGSTKVATVVTATGSPGTGNPDFSFHIGTRAPANSTLNMDRAIAEILIFDAGLTDAQLVQMHQYAIREYGVAV